MADTTASSEVTTNGAATTHEGNGAVQALVDEWRDVAYNCFSSGHKFCREVCPVMQVTRDERHTPTAFHANVIAMEKGHLSIEDVAEDYVHCTMCGACELRCPNTLFTGDFYRFRQRTIDVVRAMRTLAVEHGIHQKNWQRWAELTDRWGNEPVLGWTKETSGSKVRAWAAGLDIPTGGKTVLFADCEAAFRRPSVPRAVALLLHAAGVEFGLMHQQWCCGGPMWETGYVEIAHKMAEHNMLDWRKTGSERIVCLDPHDYITIVENYPKLDPNFDEFEIVLAVDLIADQVREGRLELTTPIERTVTYHDPCRLNKRLGVWKSPREILRAIPGLTFIDVDHVTQWSYCSGAGSNLFVEKPELSAEISRRRIAKAKELEGGVEVLVSACPWSERPLTEQGEAQGIEVLDIFELVAEAAGFEV
jgi:heterodisulfide reductase subunit D